MQIAQIVPNTRTKNEGIFDYQIPPEILPMIKIGCLVSVPFRNKKVEGIIVNIKRSSKIQRLKNILKIIDQDPVVDQNHIELAKWMSQYYIEPFSKCLFENIVPIAKRSINKETTSLKIVKTKKTISRQFLIFGDFQFRLKIYLDAIKKTLNRGKQIIILVPDLAIVPYFTKYLKNSYSLIHSGLSHTQRYQEWQNIREGKVKIVIGSNSALFTPLSNLGLIIIDQEENETYKNYQSPRFHVTKVSEKLSEISSANLILGSISPRIETYYSAQKGKYNLIAQKIKQKNISIVDMNFEKNILSLPIRKKIDFTLNQKKKIILFLNRKGEGTKFSCSDCGWILKCEKCGLPLIPQKSEVVCYNCEKKFSLAEACPKCKSINLKPYGMGTQRLKKYILDYFPKAKTIILEKNSTDTLENSNIIIATSYALKYSYKNIDLVQFFLILFCKYFHWCFCKEVE